jgi:hypothetical protein
VDPLLETCKEIEGYGKVLSTYELSKANKRRLTMSAYRRFYLGRLFGDCTKLSWEERLELLPFMKVFQKYMNFRAHDPLAESLEEYPDSDSFRKDRLIKECSRVLLRPKTEMENHFDRLTKLKVFISKDEELRVYRWNKDISFRLFGGR